LRHREAKRALAGAEHALQVASAEYDTALGEGREAALLARQARANAEVDLDIARRDAETLARQVADAHEALRLAAVEHKLSEAERLRDVFEKTAREGLARMSVDARAILRSWAEAELAIREARAAQGGGGPSIPDAEEFRCLRKGSDRVVKRERVTRWLRPGSTDPYPDEIDRRVVRNGNGGWLTNSGMSGGGQQLTARGVFERVTYAKAPASIYMPLLIESLCVPPLLGGQVPGWMPTDAHADPRTILARLVELEQVPAAAKPDLRTVEMFLHLEGAEPAESGA
jgi:hypothetical protein